MVLISTSYKNDFMEMRRFGPWSISNAGHLNDVAKLVLAISILKIRYIRYLPVLLGFIMQDAIDKHGGFLGLLDCYS